jgi:hypothetical protein
MVSLCQYALLLSHMIYNESIFLFTIPYNLMLSLIVMYLLSFMSSIVL